MICVKKKSQNKSFKFKEYETKQLDSAEVNIEDDQNIEEIQELSKEYRRTHKVEIRERDKKYQINRLKTDVGFRLIRNLRCRVRLALKGFSKSVSTMKLIGCDIEFFQSYFCSKFVNGMSWKHVMNGEIHIDHIRPCASFDLSKPSEQRKCFHYTNLQPLWAIDNLKKSAKYLPIKE